jgi:hypothetical protein
MPQVPKEELPNMREIRGWALENLPKHIVLKRIEVTYGTDFPSMMPDDFEITIEYENRVDPRLRGSNEDIAAHHAWADPLTAKIRAKWPPSSIRIGFVERHSETCGD